jgi:hypothetical protein
MKTHRTATQRRKRRASNEAAPPGAERDAVAASPAQSLEALRSPALGAAARGQAALGLQRVVGNRTVGREITEQSVQRYLVDLPENASCSEVCEWMETSNPYAAEGNTAETTVMFSWSGDWRITGRAPNFTLRLSNPHVVMDGPQVDMPEWSPRDPELRAAWQRMYRTLRRHESHHEVIARRWHRILLRCLRRLAIPVTAANREEVESHAEALVQAEWEEWMANHQTEQDRIDPFQAPLNCPSS